MSCTLDFFVGSSAGGSGRNVPLSFEETGVSRRRQSN
jgi:hypothetical protein